MPLAPLVAGGLALLVALIFALMPSAALGRLALSSGIAALVPAAEPPLGATARAALILIGGGGIGSIAWFALYLLIGTRSISIGKDGQGDTVPVLRRADAHPDAPARRPLFANQDLGTPFLQVRAPKHVVAEEPIEHDLPLDLDQPMAAHDPHALPAEPRDWFQQPARLTVQDRPQVFDAGERFETFELTPVAAKLAPPPASSKPDYDPSASIHALLDRLEKSVAKSPVAPAPVRSESLQESLASLRLLAMNR